MPTTRSLLLSSRHFHTLLLFFAILLVAMALAHGSWLSESTGAGGAPSLSNDASSTGLDAGAP
jgi:hypothetical protein